MSVDNPEQSEYGFELTAHVKRFEMQLFVFANKRKVTVSNVELVAENTGFFHLFPNKGGLCASMIINHNTSLAFVSAHLAAHEGEKKMKLRNENVAEIFDGLPLFLPFFLFARQWPFS